MKIVVASLLVILAASSVCANPFLPGSDQTRPVAIVGATIHPMTGPAIENGTVVFADGKITALGRKAPIPENALQVEAEGKHVYPGLFESFGHLGLIEIDAVRATNDLQETGRINPNVRAHVAINPDSELIPVTRSNGVLLSLCVPEGRLIPGQSAVIQHDGWTFEDLTLVPQVAMHIEWPSMSPVLEWDNQSLESQKKDRDAALQELQKAFDDARAYHQARKAAPEKHLQDVRWDALAEVLEGKRPIIISADEAQQIEAAVAFAQRERVKMILYGGYDAPFCAPLLKKHDIPVIISGTHRIPRGRDDDYDAAYTLPERIRKAGLKYCISGSERFNASNVRNLPYHAATAVAYGLPREEALKAITLYPAQILGVEALVGSLEPGKQATLFIASGDILEIATQVEAAYIQGRTVDLSSRHTELWKKYREKYRRQEGKSPRPQAPAK